MISNYKQFEKKVQMSQKAEESPQKCQENDFNDQIRSIGSWSFNQNLLYVIFLQKNKLIMQSKKKRRNLRIFDRMAEFIASRNSLQCRSHHQKLLEKLGEIKVIITNFKKYISKEQFKAKYQELFGKGQHSSEDSVRNQEIKLQEVSEQIQQAVIKTEEQPKPAVQTEVQIPQSFLFQYSPFFFDRQPMQYPIFQGYYPTFNNYQ